MGRNFDIISYMSQQDNLSSRHNIVKTSDQPSFRGPSANLCQMHFSHFEVDPQQCIVGLCWLLFIKFKQFVCVGYIIACICKMIKLDK